MATSKPVPTPLPTTAAKIAATPVAPIPTAAAVSPAAPVAAPAPAAAPAVVAQTAAAPAVAATPAPSALTPEAQAEKDKIIAAAAAEQAAAEADALKRKVEMEAESADLAKLQANQAAIDKALTTETDPTAVADLKEARISGSPMILVAAKIAADQKAKIEAKALSDENRAMAILAAEKVVRDAQAHLDSLRPAVATPAGATGAGMAVANAGALRPDQAPVPISFVVGPGWRGMRELESHQAGEEGEQMVKVILPNRGVNLTMPDQSMVKFKQGLNLTPISLASHPFLVANGAYIDNGAGKTVLAPIQAGTAEKTAPVTK